MINPADSRKAAALTLLGSLIVSLLWAMLMTATLELLGSGGDVGQLVGYHIHDHGAVFLIDSAVIWVIVALVLAATGRLWLTLAITLSVTLIVGLVNHQKLELRREPVYPSDIDFLHSPGFLVEMVGVLPLVLGVLGGALLGVLAFLAGRRSSRLFPPIRRAATPRAWLALTVGRGVAAVTCVLLLLQLSSFNAEGNRVRDLYESAGVKWAWWNQKVNYERNSVVAGLLYNLDVPAMEAPEGYTEGAMKALAAKYAAKARRINKQRSPKALDDVNVIVILSEAFSDPTAIAGVRVKKDPFPFTRRLMRRTTSGDMLAQLIGGGTANMEYEALTGLSMADYQPQLVSPYQMLVSKQKSFPSAVGYFKTRGHRAVAIHPYLKEFYHRDRVYPALGFDRFLYDETMDHHAKLPNGKFTSDAAVYDETLEQLEASDPPVLLNVVTMQNHYPSAGQFEKDWPVSAPKGVRRQLARYLTGLNASDQALKSFLARLKASSEKTAVVLYGDHLPAFWGEDIHALNGERVMKSTPYFIWTNFATKKLRTPALVSPTQFLPMLFDQLDAPLPPFYVLLRELRSAVPAREGAVTYDRRGNPLDEEDLSPKAVELLHDYRMVLYDLSVGKRYSQDALFYAPGTEPLTATLRP
ncbi:MAG TPA: LTA synthase family protein [Nocardioidaceae bacterium]|nr:LTA synthase family protein [Nocardioidaceae bacterium]